MMNRLQTLIAAALAMTLAASCGSNGERSDVVDYQMSYTVGDVAFDMVKLPAGHTTMFLSADNRVKVEGGSPQEVALDGFVISKEPVSQALWTEIMGSNPSSAQNPSAPVDRVSWTDACKFISKLNKATGKVFMLPTEAQWEYAYKTLNDNGFAAIAEWCYDNSNIDAQGDVSDYFIPDSLMLNPEGPADGDGTKIIRVARERIPANFKSSRSSCGFRLVQPTEEKLTEEFMKPLTGYGFTSEQTDASVKPLYENFEVNGVSFKMIKVRGGQFLMGFVQSGSGFKEGSSPENERPVHKVTVDDFEIGETEVTVALWNAVMGSLPYPNTLEDPRMPVRNISWYNCQTFVRKLNELTGRKFRLPTEAEWEYAAKGGQSSKGYALSGSNEANFVMWYVTNADSKVQPVKDKDPNELGLYDMSGNVWEWCYDREYDYTKDEQFNPCGAESGGNRALRGGSSASRRDACRTSNRSFIPAQNIKSTFGLRLAI